MKNGSLSDRLQAIMRKGNLTGADLSRWFERPDPTVRGWISGEHDLGGAPMDAEHVENQLGELERLLKKKQGLPVPRLTPSKRIAHLRDLKGT